MVRSAVMMARLEPYPATKHSGVEWLGALPEHWDMRRLRNAVTMRVSNVDKHVRKGETPVRLCNYVDVYKHDCISQRIDFMRATATLEEIAQFRLEEGDVLITKDSETWDDIGVPAVVTEPAEDLISGYHLALLRPFANVLVGAYLLRALQSKGLAHQFHVEAKGVTRFGLSHVGIKSVWLAVPPLPEQAAIVRFLDHADRRIRRYIRAKQKLIALLEERKQAIIREAVTGQTDVRTGLPHKRYKRTGVGWLRAVPEHWTIRRLGQIARVFNGATPSRAKSAYWESGTVPWLNSSKVNEEVVVEPSELVTEQAFRECSIAVAPAGAVILGLVGQGRTRGMSALLGIEATISQNLAAIVPKPVVDGRFLHRLLTAFYENVREMGRGGNQEALNCDLVSRLRLPVPPRLEQMEILGRVDSAVQKLARSIERVAEEVWLVREYRTRLIADVVTGRLDVREVAAALPEVDPLAADDTLDRRADGSATPRAALGAGPAPGPGQSHRCQSQGETGSESWSTA